jgi:hypothetical protein
VEVKKFDFSVRKGASVLCVEERRKGRSHVAFMGSLCIGWLLSMVEELVCFLGSKGFFKRFREGMSETTI